MATSTRTGSTFTAEEKAAMKERAKELKAEKAAQGREADAAAVLEKIAEMSESDRAMATHFHHLVGQASPELTAKLWYGMPAYSKDGTMICFFQPSDKFKTRYGTIGFSDGAQLDDGEIWATSYGVTDFTPAVDTRVIELVKRAAG
jgi:uncharacterized protein YdhG (YjbR/CyaY superfamily)